jgi:hypothetical protein
LDRLLRAALNEGLPLRPPLDDDDSMVFRRSAQQYAQKAYEYPPECWIGCAPLDKLARTCRKIVSASEGIAFGDQQRVSDRLIGGAEPPPHQ